MPHSGEITLMEACRELGYRYHRCLNAVLAGELAGRQTDSGRWMVDRASVERLKAARAQSRARVAKPTLATAVA